MATIIQDITYALRVIRRRPLAALVIVAMLAVGVGANSAIFSVVNGIVLRPLAFPDPDRLVVVFEENLGDDLLRQTVSPPKLDDWRQHCDGNHRSAQFAPTRHDQFAPARHDQPPEGCRTPLERGAAAAPSA